MHSDYAPTPIASRAPRDRSRVDLAAVSNVVDARLEFRHRHAVRGSPTVSVHVVSFNHAEFIRETLLSALTQDFDSLEVVIADDGSTDGTIEIVEALARDYPRRLVPILRGGHQGIPMNFNRALDACRGEFICLLAGDDLFLPGKVRAQVDWFERHERGAMCAHDVEHFEWPLVEGKPQEIRRVAPRVGRGAARVVRGGAPFDGISVMMRRAAMPREGYDVRFPYCADWKMWIDCLAGGREYGCVDGVFSRYRVHAKSFSQKNFMAGRTEALIMLAAVEAHYPELTRDCRAGRAEVLAQWGNTLWERGELGEARARWGAALAEDPFVARRAAINLVARSSPKQLARGALGRVRGILGRR